MLYNCTSNNSRRARQLGVPEFAKHRTNPTLRSSYNTAGHRRVASFRCHLTSAAGRPWHRDTERRSAVTGDRGRRRVRWACPRRSPDRPPSTRQTASPSHPAAWQVSPRGRRYSAQRQPEPTSDAAPGDEMSPDSTGLWSICHQNKRPGQDSGCEGSLFSGKRRLLSPPWHSRVSHVRLGIPCPPTCRHFMWMV